jgi:ABC-type bacteriocin/lantibiotic exporter with double-glycine peptidase domain
LGFSPDEIDDAAVVDALSRSQLTDFVSAYADGIYAEIGESGSTISGGQRQRLGIARALYTNPKIIILDEATSALDAVTEQAITNAIKQLKGNVTLIVVAHRLSTIQDADTVVYLADGRVLASGSFEDVRNSVPDFEEQAQVMGL